MELELMEVVEVNRCCSWQEESRMRSLIYESSWKGEQI